MITIDLGHIEHYNEETNTFEYEDGGRVRFEYSLKALYNWEGKWKKSFLKSGSNQQLTEEETIDFYRLMALDPIDVKFISPEVMQVLADYIKSENTATTFYTPPSSDGTPPVATKSKAYTAEELYALMFSGGVAIEFENRNLNRLLVILKVISSYNNPPKKMSREDVLKQNANLNAQRKAKYKTKG